MGFRCSIGKPELGWARLDRDKERTILDYDSWLESVLRLTYIGLTSSMGKQVERGLRNLRLIQIRMSSIQSLN
jgi:hypothetical protein